MSSDAKIRELEIVLRAAEARGEFTSDPERTKFAEFCRDLTQGSGPRLPAMLSRRLSK